MRDTRSGALRIAALRAHGQPSHSSPRPRCTVLREAETRTQHGKQLEAALRMICITSGVIKSQPTYNPDRSRICACLLVPPGRSQKQHEGSASASYPLLRTRSFLALRQLKREPFPSLLPLLPLRSCLSLAPFHYSSTVRCSFYNGLMGSRIHGFWSRPDRQPGMPDRLGQRAAYWTFSAFFLMISMCHLGYLTGLSDRSSSWPRFSAFLLF